MEEELSSLVLISFLCSSVCWGHLTERVHSLFVLSDTTPQIEFNVLLCFSEEREKERERERISRDKNVNKTEMCYTKNIDKYIFSDNGHIKCV